jgi:hypothetical protein
MADLHLKVEGTEIYPLMISTNFPSFMVTKIFPGIFGEFEIYLTKLSVLSLRVLGKT